MIHNKGFGFVTPSSNTGLNSVSMSGYTQNSPNTLKVDWWQGTLCLTRSEFASLQGLLSTTFADTFGLDSGYFFSGRKFDHHFVSGRGAIIAFNFDKTDEIIDICGDAYPVLNLDRKTYDVLLSLPAKVLSGCDSIYSLFSFYRFMIKLNFKPTRIDVAADDYSKSLHPSVIKQAYELGLNHGFRTASEIHNWDNDGFTIYLGSKKSDRLSRYYNKAVESEGEIDAYRFETVYRDSYAVSFWESLKVVLTSNHENCLKEEEQYRTLLSFSLNSVNFYSLSGDKDSDKIYCQWWLDFKASFDCVSAVKITVNRVKTALDSSIDWVHDKVETTLASIEYYFQETGRDFSQWLNNRVVSGRSRMTSNHINRVNSQVKLELALDGWF
jgi:hypothetical protein